MVLLNRFLVLMIVLLAVFFSACGPGGDEPAAPQATDSGDGIQGQLEALGYLPAYEPAPDKTGVTVHLAELACPGYNLFTSGHEQAARLIDMEGNLVHRWSVDFHSASSDSVPDRSRKARKSPYWRRVHLFANGDLLAIVNYNGLIRIDRDSNLLWSVRRRFHHDLHVAEDGTIYTLTYRAETVPWIDENLKLRVDYITILSPEGTIVRSISLLDAFRDSPFSSCLHHMPRRGDILHTNTIEIFDGSQAHRSPLFRKGNALVSMRSIDFIAIIDLDQEKVIWALSGQWTAQHQPTLLPNGRFLLFDNRGHRGRSKVIEFDPFTQQIQWAYEGNEENGFFTESLGASHRLDNGNTLIVESESGRVFEITPEKKVVWEYINPNHPENKDELIATIFDMVRLGRSFPLDWLTQPE